MYNKKIPHKKGMSESYLRICNFLLRSGPKLPSRKKVDFCSLQIILLFIVGELAGVGSMAVAVGVRQAITRKKSVSGWTLSKG